MAGIYLHIPFCKQICYYCDFHFSLSLKNKSEVVAALQKEAIRRKAYLTGEQIETIYLGGGTPSVLDHHELNQIFETLYANFDVSGNAEITLEANPDDLTTEYLKLLKHTPINRLSIGTQSFSNEILALMNRRHTAKQATESINKAAELGFNNITIDLIYGVPGQSILHWEQNLDKALALPAQHLSAYHLTFEPNTAFGHKLKKGQMYEITENESYAEFDLLLNKTEAAGFEHYEISNFAKAGFRSRHNSSYWSTTPYLGLGPSAHSFNGLKRRWNVSNNLRYIKSVHMGSCDHQTETLTQTDKLNEYLLTWLRTSKGINLQFIEENFGKLAAQNCLKTIANWVNEGYVFRKENSLILTRKGKFVADRISSDLFVTQVNVKL